MTMKSCENCYYKYFDARAYPCSLCVRGIERQDRWMPSKKTKDEPQTSGVVWTEDAIKNEPKSYTTWVSTNEPQTKSLEYHTDTIHFGKAKGESITTSKADTEPQCETCINYGVEFTDDDSFDTCLANECHYEPKTEKPCDNCQEWDCYGCDYKQTKRSIE